MGFSHYFPQTRSFTDTEWANIQTFAKTLFDKNEEILAGPLGEMDTAPIVNDEEISFNGIEDLSHETFTIGKIHDPNYNFCKTNRKPYDDVVVFLLTYINHVAPNVLTITSDGNDKDLEKALVILRDLLNDQTVQLMTSPKTAA